MPALDQCHDQVIRALQKDGWTLERAPYGIVLPYRGVFADAAISRQHNGMRQNLVIIEVKCFPDEDNTTRDLYISIGQLLLYRAMIDEAGLNFQIFLTVPVHIYDLIFDPAVMRVINECKINLIVVDLEAERIVQWKTH